MVEVRQLVGICVAQADRGGASQFAGDCRELCLVQHYFVAVRSALARYLLIIYLDSEMAGVCAGLASEALW